MVLNIFQNRVYWFKLTRCWSIPKLNHDHFRVFAPVSDSFGWLSGDYSHLVWNWLVPNEAEWVGTSNSSSLVLPWHITQPMWSIFIKWSGSTHVRFLITAGWESVVPFMLSVMLLFFIGIIIFVVPCCSASPHPHGIVDAGKALLTKAGKNNCSDTTFRWINPTRRQNPNSWD